MKRIIILTVVLLIAAGFITVAYFKNLSPPGVHTDKIVRNIPANASLIFEFSNDEGFYDIFKDNKLLATISGRQNLTDLAILRQTLVKKTPLSNFFAGQNVFVSIHPLTLGGAGQLLTIAAKKGFEASAFDKLMAEKNNSLLVTPFKIGSSRAYTIFIKSLNRRFFIVHKEDNIYSGSFSKELAVQSARYKKSGRQLFTLLPAQQNSNALANLYVNNKQVEPLFNKFFKNETGIFNNLRKLPATAVLSLNYKSDALMFNGTTTIDNGLPPAYINLFVNQQPVQNQLKNIFPSTTAYSGNFAVSNIKAFTAALEQWQKKAGLDKKRNALFNTIDNETGINIKAEFNAALGNEFAVLTTRFQERLAIIALKDGSRFLPVIQNISTAISGNSGRFNYDRLPYYLLGDAFGMFRKPYFLVVDNYLILANFNLEINSFLESYTDHKFLVKADDYKRFDNLMSQRSNICAFVNFKNLKPLLKRDMFADVYADFDKDELGWEDIYGVSYQLTATDKSFYTNFCIGLNVEEKEDEPEPGI